MVQECDFVEDLVGMLIHAIEGDRKPMYRLAYVLHEWYMKGSFMKCYASCEVKMKKLV